MFKCVETFKGEQENSKRCRILVEFSSGGPEELCGLYRRVFHTDRLDVQRVQIFLQFCPKIFWHPEQTRFRHRRTESEPVRHRTGSAEEEEEVTLLLLSHSSWWDWLYCRFTAPWWTDLILQHWQVCEWVKSAEVKVFGNMTAVETLLENQSGFQQQKNKSINRKYYKIPSALI